MQKIINKQQIAALSKARFVFIGLQVVALLLCQFGILYQLPYPLLYTIVSMHLAVTLIYQRLAANYHSTAAKLFFATMLLDIGFLSLLLYYTGSATNPFVSLLLLPIAIACVTLPKLQLLLVTLASMTAYSVLLYTVDIHDMHHMDITHHIFGMWLNFLLSAFVVVVIVASMIQTVSRQERMISQQREEQLRQEQLLSLGAAAAQFAHRLATPLGTAHLLTEELKEQNHSANSLIEMLESQLNICRQHLAGFRDMAEQVRANNKEVLPVEDLITALKQEIQLSFPQAVVAYQETVPENAAIVSEPILIPALLNLVQNAVNASQRNQTQKISIDFHLQHGAKELIIAIRDHGPGFKQDTLLQLGVELIESERGLGMGVFLSHVTIEKLGGRLKLHNHQDGGAVAVVELPLLMATTQTTQYMQNDKIDTEWVHDVS